MITPARVAAFDILLRVEREQSYAGELLHSGRLDALSNADRALCTELTMGVLRWRSRLDAVLAGLVSQPLASLDLEVLIALRVGAYQIGFLDRIPARAAVNEGVELVKRARKRSAAGMVNAVLRKLAANPPQMRPLPPSKPTTATELANAYSHPLWLVERWVRAFGCDRAALICAANQASPETALRLRHSGAEAELTAAGIRLAPGKLVRSARRITSGDLFRTRAFAERRVVVQDEGSQLVAVLVGEGRTLLDCCAAPGGKTSILAERNPGAMIVAADLHPRRAELMRRLLGEAQRNVHVIAADAAALPLRRSFDRILADVPCSGTGTLARNPEIKWRLEAAGLARLHERQAAILRAAVLFLSPGGRLIYSTCSLEPEENVAVVNEVLEKENGIRVCYCRLELERLQREGELVWTDLDSILHGPFLQTIPGVHPCDGFFAAILERTG